MNIPTDIQIIKGSDGNPAFVVIPFGEYEKRLSIEAGYVPNEVVGMVIEGDFSPVRAWREYLGLTQAQLAERLGVSQAAVAQFEAPSAKPRRATLRRIATALGISPGQLAF